MTLREEILKNSEGLNEWTKSKLANSYGVNAIVKHPGSSIKNTYEHEKDKDPIGMSVRNPFKKSTNKDELIRKQNAAIAVDDRKKEFNRSPYVGFYLKHREEDADKFDAYSRQKFQLGKEIFDIVNKFTASTRKGNSELKEDVLEEMPLIHKEKYEDRFETNIGDFYVRNKDELEIHKGNSLSDIIAYIINGSVYRWDGIMDSFEPDYYVNAAFGDYGPELNFSGLNAKSIISVLIHKLNDNVYNKGLKYANKVLEVDAKDSPESLESDKKLLNFIKYSRGRD